MRPYDWERILLGEKNLLMFPAIILLFSLIITLCLPMVLFSSGSEIGKGDRYVTVLWGHIFPCNRKDPEAHLCVWSLSSCL